MKLTVKTCSSIGFVIFFALTAVASDAEMGQCVLDLCGRPEAYLPASARGTFNAPVPVNIGQLITKEIDPSLDKLIALSLREKRQKITAADALAKNPKVQLTAEQKSLLALLTSMAEIAPIARDVIESDDGRIYKINPDALRAKKPSMSAEEAQKISSLISAYLSSTGYRQVMGYEGISYDLTMSYIAQNMGTQLNPYTRALILTYFHQQAADIEKRAGPFAFDGLNMQLLVKGLAGEDFSEVEKKDVKEIFLRIFSYQAMFEAPVVASASAFPLTLPEVAEKLGWAKYRDNLNAILSNGERLEAQKRIVRDLCHKRFAQAIAAAPSELRQTKALGLAELVKATSQKVLPQFVSGNALAAAAAAIGKTTFEKPMGLSKVVGFLKEGLTAESDLNEKRFALIQKASGGGEGSVDLVIRLFMDFGVKDDQDDSLVLFQDVKHACEAFQPKGFEDKSISSLSVIQMGWQTAMFPELGAGIIAHELGHVVSSAVQAFPTDTGVFAKVRSCSVQIHKNLQTGEDHGSPEQYQEEDWADKFASAVLLELNRTWPHATNYACALVGFEKETSAYPLKLPLSEKSGIDTHSTNILRALQLHARLNKPLPQSCRSTLDESTRNLLTHECR